MKDKDPNEDEFNQEEQDNINEADDSFGLPDLDFNTLEDQPDAVEEEEEVADSQEEPVAEVEEEIVAEVEEEPNEDLDQEALQDEPEEEQTESEEVEESSKVTSTYVPPKPESNAPKIIAVLIVTIIVSGAIWYFGFYRPAAVAEEKARQEQILAKEEAARIAAEKKKEAARIAAEEEANKAADADEAAANEIVFKTISEPTGRYYIVVASFIDADMAADLGNKMKVEGVSSTLLAPKGNKKFNRLTTGGDFGSFNEAQEQANKLKGDFGDGLWVLKY